VRRRRLDYESHATGLDRNEVGAMPVAAGLAGGRDHALISLLALNGLRVSEAIGADIEDLGLERGQRTITIVRKGGKIVTDLSHPARRGPSISRWANAAMGRSSSGPTARASTATRPAGSCVALRDRRGSPSVWPHTLRHAFITAALDAGVALRDVQEAASHADPRITMRYDRARVSLDRHATFIVATFLAGASG
jgi:integrase/recombinase XerD